MSELWNYERWLKKVSFQKSEKNLDTLTDGFVNLNLRIPDAAVILRETVKL